MLALLRFLLALLRFLLLLVLLHAVGMAAPNVRSGCMCCCRCCLVMLLAAAAGPALCT